MSSLRYWGACAICALLLVACGGGSAAAPTPAAGKGGPHVVATASRLLDSGASVMPNVGEAAPDFEYTLSDGSTHRLSDLRGKKVLLNFWATWCEPCRAEMPDIQKTLDANSDTLVVLGVNKLEITDVIGPFADEVGVRFPLISNPSGDISTRYAAKNIPTSFFINTDGTIGERKIGIMSYSTIQQYIGQLK